MNAIPPAPAAAGTDSGRETAIAMLEDVDKLRAQAAAEPRRAVAARLRRDADALVRTARRLLRRAPAMQ